jgi:hypothetical protein
MRRYGPAGAGIHVTLPREVALQLRTSWHSRDSSFQKSVSEQRTLNPRVRGSSPWRRTRDDLGFYSSRLFFMCPVCPGSPPVLAPCLLVGRMLGPGWLVHFRRIGLDQSIGVPSNAVTERDNRRWCLAAGLAPWSSFLVAMESGAACGRTSAPPEPAVLAGRESPRGADPGQGAFLTWAVSGSARPGVHRGYTRGTFPPWPASARPCRGPVGHGTVRPGRPQEPRAHRTAANRVARRRRLRPGPPCAGLGWFPRRSRRSWRYGQFPQVSSLRTPVVSARIQHARSEMNVGFGSARVRFR